MIVRAERRLRDWLRQHCPRIPERFSQEDMRSARVALAADEPHRAHDLTYLRRAALARHARECGYSESVVDHAFEVFFTARNELTPFSDVVPALERLKGRYALATLSNGNADLRRIGLADYFVASLCAREVGAAKPDPRCFATLTEALNLAPQEVLYVGDDPVHDVQGARDAGLRCAWMNRTGMPWPADLRRAEFEVRSCAQLAARLLAVEH